MITRALPAHPRFRVIRHQLPVVPKVAWQVEGRKQFDPAHSAAVRRMWGVGNYLNGRV